MGNEYDILITNTTIVDGTGSPAFRGNVAVTGEKITAVGKTSKEAKLIVDGKGLVTCPGFVDPHSHADLSILQFPLAENLVMQGITTFVGGNCGMCLAPLDGTAYTEKEIKSLGFDIDLRWRTFKEWLTVVEERGITPNYVPMVGHNTVRGTVLGLDFQRRATESEIRKMQALMHEAFRSGAFGLSVGLDAAWPGHFAGIDEIIELAKIARDHGAFFSPHTRHHQNQWPAQHASDYGYGIYHGSKGEIIAGRYHGLIEAVEICREVGELRLHIAHFTPAYVIPQPHPDRLAKAAAEATLADIIDTALDEGLDVSFNVLPWEQSIGKQERIVDTLRSSGALLPDWMQAGSPESFAEALKNRDFRSKVLAVVNSGRLKFGMVSPLTDPYWMDCFRIMRSQNAEHAGKTFGSIVRVGGGHTIEMVYTKSFETLFDMIVEDPQATWAFFRDKREDRVLDVFLKHEKGMPCTDVFAAAKEAHPGTMPPPITYGLYPHYLRVFVKELKALTLEKAIMKATLLPARDVIGLRDRGSIRKGSYADIQLIDMGAIREVGGFEAPNQNPLGIERVFINGALAYRKGEHMGNKPGKVLRKS